MTLNTFGVGQIRRGTKPLNIAAIPDCEFWIDCAVEDSLNFASGTDVASITDLSGNGRDLTKTGAGSETTYPVYNASEQGIQFLNTAADQMKTGAIGDWNFMHDGTGCSVLLMFKINPDFASTGVIFSTSSAGSEGIGTNFFYYNDTERFRHTVRNGSSLALSSYGQANSMEKDTNRILSVHFTYQAGSLTDTVIRSNGATDFQGNTLSSLNSGDSSSPLFFGKLSTGGNFYPKFILKKCAIFSRRLSKREENAILKDWEKGQDIDMTVYGKKDLAVIAGQDNAKGHGLISNSVFDPNDTVDNAFIFDNTPLEWNVLEAGVNNDATTNDHLGVEMNFAQTYTATSGRNLYLVKYAADSTSLPQWVTGTALFNALKDRITRAIASIEDDGYEANPVGFIWYQGESDTASPTNYNAYEANLKNLIDGLNGISQFEQTPFAIIEIQQSPAVTGTAVVQNAGITVSNTVPYSTYTHYIQTDDITTHLTANQVDAESLDAIGARLSQTLLS